jgi:hypothetical protein
MRSAAYGLVLQMAEQPMPRGFAQGGVSMTLNGEREEQ